MNILHALNIRLCHDVDEAFSKIGSPKVVIFYSFYGTSNVFEACVYINKEKRIFRYDTTQMEHESNQKPAEELNRVLSKMLAWAERRPELCRDIMQEIGEKGNGA